MAVDFVEANAGSGGAKFATERITIGADNIDFGISLLSIWVNDTTEPTKVNAANPLPVVVDPLPAGTNNIGDVDVLTLPGTIEADITAIKTAVEIIDNAIAGTEMQVDVLTVPAPLNVTGGGVEAGALRVTLANDSTGVLSVDDNGGALTVDNAGTFAVQVDAALPAGTNNIGDVDVLTFPAEVHSEDYDTGAGTDTTLSFGIALPASGGAVAGGTSSNPLRTDPTGTTTQPVSGTVTADAGTNLNTSALALETGGNLATIAGAVSGTEIQVDVVAALPAGTNNIGDVDIASLPDEGQQTMAASISVAIASDQSAVPASQSGTWTVHPGNTANTTPWLVSPVPRTAGGCSMHKTISAASTNATNVKASAGQIYSIQCFNLNGAPRYLKLYDKATAPTVGTDTPVKTLLIPGNTDGAGFTLNTPGLEFTAGIGFALTTGITDADTGAVAAGEIALNIDYK